MNAKYIYRVSVLSTMMIQKNQEISSALRKHKPKEEIAALLDDLSQIHQKIKEASSKIRN